MCITVDACQILQGQTAQWAAHEGIWTCVSQTDDGESWDTNGIVIDSLNTDPDGTAEVACGTYHLSPFALVEQEASSSEWYTAGQLAGVDVLQQVRCVQKPRRDAFPHALRSH